ncbi:PH domain [Carpediemonas membranifera]|uniref:PH domain n=1 Tax=Carpediemonas membranifera TaxID=201153 RepID=A0A8J6DXM6_9EUKA|nr:PH domain [Carpediemonas membranifera]|eukprot:KAG9390504.1 PH domain [Carpediemonas membranifera]
MLIRQGMMWKQGKIVKNWKHRYFVLLKTSTPGLELRYFHRPESSLPKGVVKITKYTCTLTMGVHGNRRYLEVRVPGRTYYMHSTSSSELEGWYNDLRQAITDLPGRR